MLGGAILGINQNDRFPGWWALLPTIGTVLLIAAGPSSWLNRSVLSRDPAVLVGLISYPLYLWHWPILWFIETVNRNWMLNLPKLLRYSTVLAASFALAYSTYRFIELPIRQVKQRERRRRGALWLLGCIAMTGVFGLLVVATSGFPARLPAAFVALNHDFRTQEAEATRNGTCFFARTSRRRRSATIAWIHLRGMQPSDWSLFGEILTRPISFLDSARCKPGREFGWHNIQHPRVNPYLGDRFPGGLSAVRSMMQSLTKLGLSNPTSLSCLLTGTFGT